MFGLGPTEIIIIVVIIALIFGVGRLPEIGGAMGKTIREFKSSVSDDPSDAAKRTPAHASATADAAPLPKAPESREGTVRREEV